MGGPPKIVSYRAMEISNLLPPPRADRGRIKPKGSGAEEYRLLGVQDAVECKTGLLGKYLALGSLDQ